MRFWNLQCLLGCVGLQSQTDGLVEDTIYNVEWLALQIHIRSFQQNRECSRAQYCILGNHLLNIECFLQTLQTVHGRAALIVLRELSG